MANCAIYEKGSDEITYFIRDCVQTGRNFKGAKGGAYGVKEHLFDTKWTDDTAKPGDSVAALTEALRYNGRVVSNRDDVNTVTQELIAMKYSDSDEKKFLRMGLSGDPIGWKEYWAYQEYIDGLVSAGQKFKEKHFKRI